MPKGAIAVPSKSDQQFEAEMDVRTLADAEKIRKDKNRFKRAMAEAKRQMDALKALGDEA